MSEVARKMMIALLGQKPNLVINTQISRDEEERYITRYIQSISYAGKLSTAKLIHEMYPKIFQEKNGSIMCDINVINSQDLTKVYNLVHHYVSESS